MPTRKKAAAPAPDAVQAAPKRSTRKTPAAPAPEPPAETLAEVAVIAPAPIPAPPPADPDEADKPATAVVKRKDLVDRVTTLTGAKRKLVKSVVEATLSVLGEALSRGEDLRLPPFGNARVNRTRGEEGARTLTVKLRRGSGKGAKEALAEPGEDD
jgi:nucleoid DNA-binding protein